MDDKTRRGCLWAAGGGCVLLVIIGAALVVGGGLFVYQNVSMATEQVSEAGAEAEFDTLRARFAGQQPLVVVDEHGEGRLVPRDRPASGTIESVHLVAYDPQDGQIARMSMPFWLLRLAPDGKVSLGREGHADLGGVRLTVRDVEEAGPGLILDQVDRRGQRVLIWAE
jgi:hypothetical protein